MQRLIGKGGSVEEIGVSGGQWRDHPGVCREKKSIFEARCR